MKHTGIVRRIDDIGRLVLPKEIRHKYRIREGDPIEICEGEKTIELMKYSMLDSFDQTANAILREFYRIVNVPVVLCALEKVCKAKGIEIPKEQKTSEQLYNAMIRRNNNFKGLLIAEGYSATVETLELILIRGETAGAVIIPETENILTETQKELLEFCANAIAASIDV